MGRGGLLGLGLRMRWFDDGEWEDFSARFLLRLLWHSFFCEVHLGASVDWCVGWH
jgi:hypothetical protein